MKSRISIIYMLVSVSMILAASLLAVGCGDDSAAQTSSQLAQSQAFVASATPAKGTKTGEETKVGEVTQVRNAGVSYEIVATDPRLDGTFDVNVNYDDRGGGILAMWGTWTLTNDKGTWVCDSWRGAIDEQGRSFTVGLGRGTGAYEGLISLWQWYWPLSISAPSAGLPYAAVSGWVQKAQ